MNTTLEPVRETLQGEPLTLHPPTSLPALAARTPRTSLLDRAAMWLGLRLMLWGTRPAPLRHSVPWHEHRREMAQLRLQLELDRARMFHSAWSRSYGR